MAVPNIMRPPQFAMNDFIAALPAWCREAFMAEIGCYQGESTEAFAKSGKFKSIIAIDRWSNELYDPADKATLHCDMAIVEAAFDARMEPYFGLVVKRKAKSVNAVAWVSPRSLDLVYIDADHRYEPVREDIKLWLPKLKMSGIMAGHDYGTHPGVKKAVDELFGKPDKVFKDCSWMVQR